MSSEARLGLPGAFKFFGGHLNFCNVTGGIILILFESDNIIKK